jgi:penicillin amidase
MTTRPVATLLLASLSLVALAAAPAAADAPRLVPGLEKPARIVRDARGIPHVEAASEHDLFFLNGWVHAEDRLFQMDASRRQASGTLAELLGPDALPSDVQLRTLGLRRAAERSLPALSARAQAALAAYAAGVNAWVASHPLPPEYAVLELTRFQPWTPADSVVVGKLIAFGLSFDLDDLDRTVALLSYRQAGALLGFDGAALFFEDLFRSQPFSPASTVPDATGAPSAPGGGRAGAGRDDARRAATLDLARRWLEQVDRVPLLRALRDRERRGGSNEWGVTGAVTESGYPMIANDPHLALNTPSTFHVIHLRGAGFDVAGHAFPGAPFVILGHNARVAWGATTNPMDVTDVFQERIVPSAASPSGLATVHGGALEPVVPIPVVFKANRLGDGIPDDVVAVPPGGGIPPAVLIVPRRNRGPIVQLDLAAGTALTVQYTGFSATRELDAFLAWNLARSVDDFEAGLQWFDVGSQNWAVVDVRGDLAYFASAEMPLREDLQAGAVHGLPPMFVRDGTGGNEWLPETPSLPGQALPYAILPPEEMPHVRNPSAGFFVNANNDPAGTTLDNDPLNQLRPGGGIYYLSPGYDGFRAGRITEMIRARLARGERLSAADLGAMQADVALLDAELFAPLLVEAFGRAGRSGAPDALAAVAADAGVAEAVERLAAWDFTTPTGIPEGYDASDAAGVLSAPSGGEIASSVAATIYAAFRSELVRTTIDARLDPLGLPRPDGQQSLSALRHLLEATPFTGVGASGVDFFAVPGLADPLDRRDAVLLGALRGALDLLAGPAFAPAFGGSTDQGDWRWGRLHRIVLDHPLGGPFSVPPAGGAFPPPLAGLDGIPVDGGFGTVDAASHDVRAASAGGFTFGSGPVRRTVAEGRPGGIREVTSLPGGESGVLGSPFYVNLLPDWLTDEAFPLSLSQGDAVRGATSLEVLAPARAR